jgi:hypothetical protein
MLWLTYRSPPRGYDHLAAAVAYLLALVLRKLVMSNILQSHWKVLASYLGNCSYFQKLDYLLACLGRLADGDSRLLLLELLSSMKHCPLLAPSVDSIAEQFDVEISVASY